MYNPRNCQQHNEMVILVDRKSSDQKNRDLCRFCLIKNSGDKNRYMVPEMEFEKKHKILTQIKDQNQFIYRVLQKLRDDVNAYKYAVQFAIEKFQQSIDNEMSNIIEVENQWSFTSNSSKSQCNINEQSSKIFNLLQKSIESLSQKTKTNNLLSQLQKLEDICKSKRNSFSIEQQFKGKFEPFQYKLIENFTKKELDDCYTMAFNDDASLIFFGCNRTLKISQFKNGEISQYIQQVTAHSDYILCLNFLKKTQELISTSRDSIYIWNQNKNDNQWKIKLRINEHKGYIYSFVVNHQENQFISGSADGNNINNNSIKFWQKQGPGWSCQQTFQTQFWVTGLSWNENSDTLIVCGYQKPVILIFKQIQSKKWELQQTIKVQKYGLRLGFINSTLFAFQPDQGKYLEIYEQNISNGQFQKIQEVEVKNSEGNSLVFPCQYFKDKGILIVKNNCYLNIIRRLENGKFQTQQSIFFERQWEYGRATNDGEFLVTWDDFTKEFQVRKLEYTN